jgi:hypothetical protein
MVDVRLHTETERVGYGTFRFAKLPVPGDWVKVEPACTYGGAFVVVRVEHHPTALPIPPTAKQDPSVSVYVRAVQDRCGAPGCGQKKGLRRRLIALKVPLWVRGPTFSSGRFGLKKNLKRCGERENLSRWEIAQLVR